MQDNMINTDQEKTALMLFARAGLTDDYKRMLCYIVWHRLSKSTEQKSVPLDGFLSMTSDLMMVDKQDIKAAIAALKTPQFGAVNVWNRRGTGLTLVQAKMSGNMGTWLNSVNVEYPYFKEMVA